MEKSLLDSGVCGETAVVKRFRREASLKIELFAEGHLLAAPICYGIVSSAIVAHSEYGNIVPLEPITVLFF